MLLFRTLSHDYENLCSIYVLGVKIERAYQDKFVYDEFRIQEGQNSEGWYKPTNFLWETNHFPLDINKNRNLGRLNSSHKSLNHANYFDFVIATL